MRTQGKPPLHPDVRYGAWQSYNPIIIEDVAEDDRDDVIDLTLVESNGIEEFNDHLTSLNSAGATKNHFVFVNEVEESQLLQNNIYSGFPPPTYGKSLSSFEEHDETKDTNTAVGISSHQNSVSQVSAQQARDLRSRRNRRIFVENLVESMDSLDDVDTTRAVTARDLSAGGAVLLQNTTSPNYHEGRSSEHRVHWDRDTFLSEEKDSPQSSALTHDDKASSAAKRHAHRADGRTLDSSGTGVQARHEALSSPTKGLAIMTPQEQYGAMYPRAMRLRQTLNDSNSVDRIIPAETQNNEQYTDLLGRKERFRLPPEGLESLSPTSARSDEERRTLWARPHNSPEGVTSASDFSSTYANQPGESSASNESRSSVQDRRISPRWMEPVGGLSAPTTLWQKPSPSSFPTDGGLGIGNDHSEAEEFQDSIAHRADVRKDEAETSRIPDPKFAYLRPSHLVTITESEEQEVESINENSADHVNGSQYDRHIDGGSTAIEMPMPMSPIWAADDVLKARMQSDRESGSPGNLDQATNRTKWVLEKAKKLLSSPTAKDIAERNKTRNAASQEANVHEVDNEDNAKNKVAEEKEKDSGHDTSLSYQEGSVNDSLVEGGTSFTVFRKADVVRIAKPENNAINRPNREASDGGEGENVSAEKLRVDLRGESLQDPLSDKSSPVRKRVEVQEPMHDKKSSLQMLHATDTGVDFHHGVAEHFEHGSGRQGTEPTVDVQLAGASENKVSDSQEIPSNDFKNNGAPLSEFERDALQVEENHSSGRTMAAGDSDTMDSEVTLTKRETVVPSRFDPHVDQSKPQRANAFDRLRATLMELDEEIPHQMSNGESPSRQRQNEDKRKDTMSRQNLSVHLDPMLSVYSQDLPYNNSSTTSDAFDSRTSKPRGLELLGEIKFETTHTTDKSRAPESRSGETGNRSSAPAQIITEKAALARFGLSETDINTPIHRNGIRPRKTSSVDNTLRESLKGRDDSDNERDTETKEETDSKLSHISYLGSEEEDSDLDTSFESTTVPMIVRMLDKGCAWLEGNNCGFDSPSLLKESKTRTVSSGLGHIQNTATFSSHNLQKKALQVNKHNVSRAIAKRGSTEKELRNSPAHESNTNKQGAEPSESPESNKNNTVVDHSLAQKSTSIGVTSGKSSTASNESSVIRNLRTTASTGTEKINTSRRTDESAGSYDLYGAFEVHRDDDRESGNLKKSVDSNSKKRNGGSPSKAGEQQGGDATNPVPSSLVLEDVDRGLDLTSETLLKQVPSTKSESESTITSLSLDGSSSRQSKTDKEKPILFTKSETDSLLHLVSLDGSSGPSGRRLNTENDDFFPPKKTKENSRYSQRKVDPPVLDLAEIKSSGQHDEELSVGIDPSPQYANKSDRGFFRGHSPKDQTESGGDVVLSVPDSPFSPDGETPEKSLAKSRKPDHDVRVSGDPPAHSRETRLSFNRVFKEPQGGNVSARAKATFHDEVDRLHTNAGRNFENESKEWAKPKVGARMMTAGQEDKIGKKAQTGENGEHGATHGNELGSNLDLGLRKTPFDKEENMQYSLRPKTGVTQGMTSNLIPRENSTKLKNQEEQQSTVHTVEADRSVHRKAGGPEMAIRRSKQETTESSKNKKLEKKETPFPIDAEVFMDLTEAERLAALELAEQLRSRAEKLKNRRKKRNKQLKKSAEA